MSARSQKLNEKPVPGNLALGAGHRLTKQRREVYDILLSKRDHPTATEVFVRAKERVPHISLATVYNCLETLTGAGLVRQVTLDRGPARYCPNLHEHGHFYCDKCGEVMDIDLAEAAMGSALRLPKGAQVDAIEITIKGCCAACAPKEAPKTKKATLGS
jgi:Fe2+ or Zn2+ uptake regulation protein